MGKPAARLGDSAAHGGTLAGGCTSVLIGGKPASILGVDFVCPATNGVVLHVGGKVTSGSATVKIGGKAAARLGDSVQCVGEAGTILAGEPKVLIGG